MEITTYKTVNKSSYGILVDGSQYGWGIEKRGDVWQLLDFDEEVVFEAPTKRECLTHFKMWH